MLRSLLALPPLLGTVAAAAGRTPPHRALGCMPSATNNWCRYAAPSTNSSCAGCLTFRDVSFAVMTGLAMHGSRCQLIKHGYAKLLPKGHLTFYSDADDATLPAVKVIEPAPAGQSVHEWAQRKWIPGLVAAFERSRKLGTKWTMVADDDTYVNPRNLLRVLQGYDASNPMLLGQKCGILEAGGGSERALCGGAGWAMTTPLHRELVRVMPRCEGKYYRHGSRSVHRADTRRLERHSDRFLSRCFYHELNVSLVDRSEFNSQPPLFYETSLGHNDRPRGYGSPATFHYLTVRRHRELLQGASDQMIWQSLEHQVGLGRRL